MNTGAPSLRWARVLAACGVSLVPLAGCDQLKERAGIPDQARIEAEGKAIGAACRHAGRGLEDCYALNDKASKAAVFAGWKEMNEYMIKNNMEAVPSAIGQPPTSAVEETAPAAGKGG